MNHHAHGLRALTALGLILSACGPTATPTPTSHPPTATSAPTQTAPPSPTPAPLPTPIPTSAVDDIASRLDAIFKTAAAEGAFTGSVLIARDGEVLLVQGYGLADRANKVANTPQTKYRLATLTQLFTAVAILQLQDQGRLTVQDQVCTYVSDCPNGWSAITLHELLTHSSGLSSATDLSLPADQQIQAASASELKFEPGKGFAASPVGYLLLGKVIEKASGQTYEAYLQEHVFDPLKMTGTGYDYGQGDLASGYSGTGTTAVKLVDAQALFAAGAVYSTVEDLYRLDEALYTEALLSQNSVGDLFTGYVQNPEYPAGMKAGYGGFTILLPDPPRLAEGTGYIDGFGYVSVVQRWPDDRSVIIILSNQQTVSVWDFAAQVNKELFGR